MAAKPGAAFVDPRQAFAPRVVILSPHADDETLGCGGLMALLSGTHEIYVIFATDGSRSPENPRHARAHAADLVAAREAEAREAMAVLGVPASHLRFLRFPDGALSDHRTALRETLITLLAELGSADVLVPFRYDWHPDHLALFRAARGAFATGAAKGRLVEYFVYTQRRLLPGGDVRSYVRPSRALRVDTAGVAGRKLRALECFRSQTTLYFDWQRRPILTSQLLRRMSGDPECFLPWEPAAPHDGLRAPGLVRFATVLEPPLKRAKDGVLEWVRR